jgi:hypothetical protein
MGERIALVVANLHHRDDILEQLPAADVNVELLASLLSDPEIGNFDQVTLLVDEPAERIEAQIKKLYRLRQWHDLLLLYIVGDGLVDECGELLFPTIDSCYGQLATAAVPANFISGWMDRSFSRRQVVVVDGRLVWRAAVVDGRRRSTMSVGALFQGVGDGGRGRVVLSSSNEVQLTLTANGVKGGLRPAYFTQALVEGLQTGAADQNGDTLVELGELFEYVSGRLREQGVSLNPQIWRYGERDELIIIGRRIGAKNRLRVKWDLLFGAVFAPLAIVLIGGRADLSHAGVMAVLFFVFYASLYILLEE